MSLEGQATNFSFPWSKFDQYQPCLSCFDGLILAARRRKVILPRSKVVEDDAGDGDEFLASTEHIVSLDESDESFQDHISKWKDQYVRYYRIKNLFIAGIPKIYVI